MNRPLFIFEMANNHQGSVEHGKNIIRAMRAVCDEFPQFDYAFKFQYRELDTFIHPDFKDRMDVKNIKRFQDTKLTQEQFKELFDEVKANNFMAICTPFDEVSADRIAEQGYDYIKIASCSFTDWPLLERIAAKKMPVIASGAGSSLADIHRVVAFFTNRGIDLTLMHCVAEYPTANAALQMNQINFYKNEFPELRIGFSTHEDPNNMLPVQLAVAKGAEVFEKHVGLPTEEITLNGYSANPDQVRAWLAAAEEAYEACGVSDKRYESSAKEQSDLAALRRGVFATSDMGEGELDKENVFLAFPCCEGQLTATDLSKYNKIVLKPGVQIKKNAPIMLADCMISDISATMLSVIKDITTLLKESNVVVPVGSVCEISHHYGIENYRDTGVAMISLINREYCKKILVVLPGQSHPSHYHEKKEETFVVIHGDLHIELDGVMHHLHKGDIMTVERGVNHNFSSETGCIFEEISTTHYANDSYYELADTFVEPRKTMVHFTKDVI